MFFFTFVVFARFSPGKIFAMIFQLKSHWTRLGEHMKNLSPSLVSSWRFPHIDALNFKDMNVVHNHMGSQTFLLLPLWWILTVSLCQSLGPKLWGTQKGETKGFTLAFQGFKSGANSLRRTLCTLNSTAASLRCNTLKEMKVKVHFLVYTQRGHEVEVHCDSLLALWKCWPRVQFPKHWWPQFCPEIREFLEGGELSNFHIW